MTLEDAVKIWAKRVFTSFEKVLAKPTHQLPNLAGSLSDECLIDILVLVAIWTLPNYRQWSQHAPNEHVPEVIFDKAIQT